MCKDLMTERVVGAIRKGETIYLGCRISNNSYRRVFVIGPALEPPSHVFTAWRRAGSGGQGLDTFVSAEVEITGYPSKGSPRLETKA